MVYAMNVFNLVEGAEEEYRRYAVEAGRVLQRVGASVVVAGRDPLRMLEGDLLREWFMVVQFPDERAFSEFLSLIDCGPMHGARERATRDYVWTLYQPWSLAGWVNA